LEAIYALVLVKRTPVQRAAVSRWFHIMTKKEGKTAAELRSAVKSLGLSGGKNRLSIEMLLLRHPGL
jgi:hypothetical protein